MSPKLNLLDDRVTTLSARMRTAGATETADELDSCAAYVREAWRGSDVREDLAEDLQTVADNAARMVEIVLAWQDRV